MLSESATPPSAALAKRPFRFEPATRLRRLVESDPLLCGCFAVLWVCALVPIWWPRMLPLLDLPNHLDSIAVWHHYDDPTWGFQRFYDLSIKPYPYWGYFFPVHMLSYLAPIEIANKIYISIYALTLPVAVAALGRRMGRSAWLSLFSFPLVFSINFSYGFVTFCAGITLALFGFIALDRFLASATRWNALALCLLSFALYLTHLLPWIFFGLAASTQLFCHGWRPRRMAAAAALMLPSVGLGVLAYKMAAAGATIVQKGPVSFRARYYDTLTTMQRIPTHLITIWPGDRPFKFLLVLAAAWLAIVLTTRTTGNDDAARRFGFRFRLELLFAVAVLVSFALPSHLYEPVDLWMIGLRFISVAALLGCLLPHGEIVGRRRLLLLPVLLLAIWYPIELGAHWHRFDRRASAFRRVMTHVPRGSSTLTLILGARTDPDVDKDQIPILFFHSYAQFFAGGYNPYGYATGFPMVTKPGAALPAPAWDNAGTFDFNKHGVFYDFIVTNGEDRDHGVFGPDDSGRAPLVYTDGPWRLYEVRKTAH